MVTCSVSAYHIGEDHHADGRRTSSLVVVWCAVGGCGGRRVVARGKASAR